MQPDYKVWFTYASVKNREKVEKGESFEMKDGLGEFSEDERPDFYYKNCIKAIYCQCLAGTRTVGLCVHGAAALIGLSVDPHQRPKQYQINKRGLLTKETFMQNDTEIIDNTVL